MVTGNNINFKLINEVGAFELNDSFVNCHLSLSISDNSFSFTLLNLSKEKYVYFKKYAIESISKEDLIVSLNSLFKQEPLFSKEFNSISASMVSKGNSIVPSGLYDKKEKRKYFSFNISDTVEDVDADYMPNLNAYNLYAVLPELDELLVMFFPSIKRLHYSSILTDSAVTCYREEKREKILLFLFDGFFDLIVLKNGKLQFQNTFSVQSTTDIAYFLMHSSKELNLSLENASFNFYGNNDILNQLSEVIKPYVRHIDTAETINDAEIDFKESLARENIDLFNQYRCV